MSQVMNVVHEGLQYLCSAVTEHAADERILAEDLVHHDPPRKSLDFRLIFAYVLVQLMCL